MFQDRTVLIATVGRHRTENSPSWRSVRFTAVPSAAQAGTRRTTRCGSSRNSRPAEGEDRPGGGSAGAQGDPGRVTHGAYTVEAHDWQSRSRRTMARGNRGAIAFSITAERDG